MVWSLRDNLYLAGTVLAEDEDCLIRQLFRGNLRPRESPHTQGGQLTRHPFVRVVAELEVLKAIFLIEAVEGALMSPQQREHVEVIVGCTDLRLQNDIGSRRPLSGRSNRLRRAQRAACIISLHQTILVLAHEMNDSAFVEDIGDGIFRGYVEIAHVDCTRYLDEESCWLGKE